jgi:hypothetical protein
MIKKHHSPAKPIEHCNDSTQGCPEPPKGLGDQVARLAKPIAKILNRQAPRVQRLALWMQHVGQASDRCGCKTRQACLNQVAVELQHPFKTIAAILQCFRNQPKKH